MQNDALDTDETWCFRLENPNEEELYVWGNLIWHSNAPIILPVKTTKAAYARTYYDTTNDYQNNFSGILARPFRPWPADIPLPCVDPETPPTLSRGTSRSEGFCF
jgi:hypothetical protein